MDFKGACLNILSPKDQLRTRRILPPELNTELFHVRLWGHPFRVLIPGLQNFFGVESRHPDVSSAGLMPLVMVSISTVLCLCCGLTHLLNACTADHLCCCCPCCRQEDDDEDTESTSDDDDIQEEKNLAVTCRQPLPTSLEALSDPKSTYI